MKITTALLCCILTFFISLPLSGCDSLSNQSRQPKNEQHKSGNEELLHHWISQDKIPDRVSFLTRTGTVLLRKEDIISFSIQPNEDGVMLRYRKNGLVKAINCQTTLANVIKILGEFPFVRINRSAIINMNEIDRYEGTRRNAILIMSDGSKIKPSRNMAEHIHKWIDLFRT